MKTKIRLLFFSSFLFGVMIIHAQTLERNVISSTGNLSYSGELIVSATSGEVAVSTLDAGDVKLLQGFQQPNPEDFVGTVEIGNIQFDISITPNPTSSFLQIDLNSSEETNLLLQLFDANGKRSLLAKRANFSGDYTLEFNMKNLVSGMYLLIIRDSESKILTSYKIQKI